MTINREAFNQAVNDRSPLTPEQVDRLFGEVTADNKATVWAFLQCPASLQMAAYNVLSAFPEAKVENVK